MKKIVRNLMCLTAALSLNACMTHTEIPLSQPNQVKLSKVYINPDIKVSNKMYYFGNSQSTGAVFGLIGSAIGGAIAKTDKDKIEEKVEKNNIDIKKIVYQNVNYALDHSKYSKVTSLKEASSVIDLDVKMFGFTVPNGFTVKLKPVLKVLLTAKNKNGSTIWQEQYFTGILGNKLPGYKAENLNLDPKLIEQAWNYAATETANSFVSKCCQIS